jgi:hypothetical protein
MADKLVRRDGKKVDKRPQENEYHQKVKIWRGAKTTAKTTAK